MGYTLIDNRVDGGEVREERTTPCEGCGKPVEVPLRWSPHGMVNGKPNRMTCQDCLKLER